MRVIGWSARQNSWQKVLSLSTYGELGLLPLRFKLHVTGSRNVSSWITSFTGEIACPWKNNPLSVTSIHTRRRSTVLLFTACKCVYSCWENDFSAGLPSLIARICSAIRRDFPPRVFCRLMEILSWWDFRSNEKIVVIIWNFCECFFLFCRSNPEKSRR